MSEGLNDWLLINHIGSEDQGSLTTLSSNGGTFVNESLTATHNSENIHQPWFLGLLENKKVILFDPDSKVVSLVDKMPKNAYPAYSYKDELNQRIWFMNDGDKKNGNDELNCSGNGSTVTIFEMSKGLNPPKYLKTLCVGAGHHVTTFIAPNKEKTNLPKIAYVSNLLSGSICVIGNDSQHVKTYLKIIHTINLCEPDKEKDNHQGIPNNAFPHGKQLSYATGKIYSLNNGYGTVAVINPNNHKIETRIPLKGCSNLLLSPCGKFLIGKGADRKSNDQHVLGRISIIDALSYEVLSEDEIRDFYPSTYRFNPAGTKLYVTSAATGKGDQKNNLDIDTLYIYDVTQLPKMNLIKSMRVGKADCGRRPIAFNTDASAKRVFVPNPSDATVTILDAESDEILETVKIAEKGGEEFNFSFWPNNIYGA